MAKKRESYDVFISYAGKDYRNEDGKIIPNNPILKIRNRLDSAGITYWFDESGIYSSQEFMPVLVDAITKSKVVIFVSSAMSNASMYTPGEIKEAIDQGKPIIPFKIDNSEYSKLFRILLNTRDYIDYTQNASEALDDMVNAVKKGIAEQDEKIRIALDLENKEHNYFVLANVDAIVFVNEKQCAKLEKGEQSTIKLKNGIYAIRVCDSSNLLDYVEKQIQIHDEDVYDTYYLGIKRLIKRVIFVSLSIVLLICSIWGITKWVKQYRDNLYIEHCQQLYSRYMDATQTADSIMGCISEYTYEEGLKDTAIVRSLFTEAHAAVMFMDSVENLSWFEKERLSKQRKDSICVWAVQLMQSHEKFCQSHSWCDNMYWQNYTDTLRMILESYYTNQ